MTAGLVLASMTPAVTAAAVDPPDHGVDIESIIDGMTLEQKVGQMFVPYMYGATIDEQDNRNVTAAGVRSIGEMIDEFHPGGIIYFGWSNNLNNPAQVAQLSNDIQARSTAGGGVPATISIDQEEGVVVRLPQPSAQLPGAMALGATRNPEHARNAARITAEKLAAVGVNQDYSPIADVNSNAENPVIGVRAFGGDTELVSALTQAQVHGYQDDGGISASVKHFPGHGDTAVDSHYGVPLIEKSEAEFRAEDLPPFQAAIDAGTDSIMTAHIVVPALDPSGRPATFSEPILTGLLREEMGFDGVIVTDSLSMAGARAEFGDARVPVEAILAGADQMLMPYNLRTAYDGVMAAVADGEITEERIEESVRRILTQKAKRGVLQDPMVDLDAVADVMATPEHYTTAQEIADDSITLLKNDGVLPLAQDTNILVTGWGDTPRLTVVADTLRAQGLTVHQLRANNPTQAVIDVIVNDARDRDAVLVMTQSAGFALPDNQRALVDALAELDTTVIEVSVRNPYDTATTTAGTDAALAAYGYADPSLRAIAKVVTGQVNPSGRLPVAIPTADGEGELYALGHGLRYGTEVTPAPVFFTDRSGATEDTLTIPAVEGVTYLLDGEPIAAGVHTASGEVTVTAVADEGYHLARNVESEWTHVFDTSERTPTVRLGVEVLLEDQLDMLAGKRVGLITNPTGVDSELTHTMDLLIEHQEEGDYELTALYAPEHGILGGAPAGASVQSYVDPRTGLTVWSLYGATQRPTAAMLEDVDVLLFDIQDIGARFYTYIWTMYYAIDAAGEFGKDFVVLDRPNPLGERMDGPVLDRALSSFVGLREIPMQHGLTVGELGLFFNEELVPNKVENFDVVEMEGYDPADFVDGYGLEWVLPSPNIPTIETAWAYVGTGLVESINASEGRGTTKPFLWAGHRAIDEVEAYNLAADLNSRGLEGVHFRPMFANPTTSKEAGQLSGGVELHITDPATYVPVRTGLHLLDALLQVPEIDWREGTVYPTQRCETEAHTCWIDRLTGDKQVRAQLEAGVDPDEIIAGWDAELAEFDAQVQPYRLYAGATEVESRAKTPTLRLGVEVLLQDNPELLEGKRVGLITNPTGVDSELTHTMDLLIAGEDEGGYELTALYAPEHGILGGAPAGASVQSYVDPRTGLTVWSLYGATQRPTEEMLEDVDVLLFDIQDVGARFYTYIWTMYYAMDAAAEFGKDFVVLDRPNPLGDRMDGPVLDRALSSFVGLREIPMQHGLTVGELAALFNGEFLTEPVENFSVVEMDGYDPADFVEGYGLQWVLPSPNIPTLETAWAYAGTGLVESLNASEGRGTTKPFLWVGHRAINEVEAYDLAAELNSRGLAGVHFRPMFANPTTSKEAGFLSGGVEIHITDPASYVPVRTGLHVVDALLDIPEVDWREGTVYPTQRCETEADTCWMDRLTGDKNVRLQLEAGVDPDEIIAGWDAELAEFDALAEQYRLYGEDGPVGPEISVTADTRCVVGRVVEVVRVSNSSDVPVEMAITSEYGSRTVTVGADRASSVTFSTRLGSVEAGEVSVIGSAEGYEATTTATAPYDARACG